MWVDDDELVLLLVTVVAAAGITVQANPGGQVKSLTTFGIAAGAGLAADAALGRLNATPTPVTPRRPATTPMRGARRPFLCFLMAIDRSPLSQDGCIVLAPARWPSGTPRRDWKSAHWNIERGTDSVL
ncbi:MAG: hypothetical protein UY42_C0022G0008 [Parcubacteria group bacterium GW2011_GWA2_49_16]|nr:MAG: hypothetical protein UY42_C0022G0008 [Parcubacteria group bacterium GW2011_GWA2_49_16]